jgi:tRNA pseudouridine32 synthase/23S rRNA pseudouridine746 synthase
LLGDRLYPVVCAPGDRSSASAADFEQPLQLLARQIEFTDPFRGRVCRFDSQRRLNLPL